MLLNAWPDNAVRDDKFVGHEVQVPRPAFLEPLVPNAASEHSAESLSRALSAAISSQEFLLCNSSHVGSDELMRATVERRDAMTTVRDALDLLPPDALIDEPMIRQRYPQVPGWLPQLLQVALGGEVHAWCRHCRTCRCGDSTHHAGACWLTGVLISDEHIRRTSRCSTRAHQVRRRSQPTERHSLRSRFLAGIAVRDDAGSSAGTAPCQPA